MKNHLADNICNCNIFVTLSTNFLSCYYYYYSNTNKEQPINSPNQGQVQNRLYENANKTYFRTWSWFEKEAKSNSEMSY